MLGRESLCVLWSLLWAQRPQRRSEMTLRTPYGCRFLQPVSNSTNTRQAPESCRVIWNFIYLTSVNVFFRRSNPKTRICRSVTPESVRGVVITPLSSLPLFNGSEIKHLPTT
ncbi:hypothetical protein F4801DRAFT_546649 [Xylaria longipes]|nr:hypothetical protein F4801DRAFT_546649 [Xylaria longipes]